MAEKVTIEELEAILDDAPGSIELQQDGSIKAIDRKPRHAKPRILTLKQALGGSY